MYAVALEYLYKKDVYVVLFATAIIVLAYLWSLFWDKIDCNGLELTVGIALGIFILFSTYLGYLNKYTMGTAKAIEFLQLLVTILTIPVISYIKVKWVDYLVFICAIYSIQIYCYPSEFRNSMLFLSGWLLLCIMVKRRFHSLKKMAVPLLISFITAQISYLLYGVLFTYRIRDFYYDISKRLQLLGWQKFIFLTIFSFGFIISITTIMLLMKKFLQAYFYHLKDFSEKYEEIGQYLLIIPLLFGMALFLWDIITLRRMKDINHLNTCIMLLFTTGFMGMQLFYLKLLLKTVQLKEHLTYKEAEQINIKLYNRDISKNIQEIREIKHDLKNIFLTMGEFVAKSSDKELKEYYYKNIAPFAGNKIKMNDLYVELQELQNESLKAFLYYKLIQGMDSHINMQMEAQMDHSVFPYLSNVSDIIRMLGIFLDNAMEESMQVQEGFVKVIIKERQGQISISVKNAVRVVVKQTGIHKGITSKGLGRGNGLSIVDNLVNKHDDILWNSYFQDDVYVQVISIIKEKGTNVVHSAPT